MQGNRDTCDSKATHQVPEEDSHGPPPSKKRAIESSRKKESASSTPAAAQEEPNTTHSNRLERKRERERKRRREVIKAFEELFTQLLEIDPSLEGRYLQGTSSAATTFNHERVLSQSDLMRHAVAVIRKLHQENESRKLILEGFQKQKIELKNPQQHQAYPHPTSATSSEQNQPSKKQVFESSSGMMATSANVQTPSASSNPTNISEAPYSSQMASSVTLLAEVMNLINPNTTMDLANQLQQIPAVASAASSQFNQQQQPHPDRQQQAMENEVEATLIALLSAAIVQASQEQNFQNVHAKDDTGTQGKI